MKNKPLRSITAILFLTCSLFACQAKDKNAETVSAVVTNILTMPNAVVQEMAQEEANSIDAPHDAYEQVLGGYVAENSDGIFIWWQTFVGYSSNWNFTIAIDELTVSLKENKGDASVYHFQAQATIVTSDQKEHPAEFSGVVQLASDGKADYMDIYGSGMDVIHLIISQPL